ncbi:phosphotransferase family protein [soil metagenome]
MSTEPSAPPALPGLDVTTLQTWLAAHHPELLGAATLNARIIAGGLSNLTYAIDGAREPLVLRRPPLGHVQTTAHDMAREFRVISALAGSAVPVPRAVLFVDDPSSGVDAPYYLMQRVEGHPIVTRADSREFSRPQLHDISTQLATTLAELHAIDPASVGLADFGRAEGFLARQLDRWGRQYDGSRSRDLPELDSLQSELGAGLPDTRRSTLVHGDYRLDNAMVTTDAAGDPFISAILDWEMATIGDPLTDLGLFGLYWNLNSFEGMSPETTRTAVVASDGYPSFDELVDTYASTAGVTVPELPWYLGLAAFKLAVIVEGIHFRFQAGQTVGEGFERVGRMVEPIARAGRRALADGTATDRLETGGMEN